jgi:polyisoprenoid-binding protein YceI
MTLPALLCSALAVAAPVGFRIVPVQSRIGFDAKSTLHDFTGTTNQVHGAFRLDWDRLAETQVAVRVVADQLNTGTPSRDDEMRKNKLETARFPAIRFEAKKLEPRESDAKAGTAKATIRGMLWLHGVQKEVAVEASLAPLEGTAVRVKGTAPIDIRDFGISPPRTMVFVKMDPKVTVTFDLRAERIADAEWDAAWKAADLPPPPPREKRY